MSKVGRVGTRFTEPARKIAAARRKEGRAAWIKSTNRRNARKK